MASVNIDAAQVLGRWLNGLRAFVRIVLCFLIGGAAAAVASYLVGFLPGVSVTGGAYTQAIVFGVSAWAAKDAIGETAGSVL